MGLILADHESGFEIARQVPAFLTGGAILLVVAGLLRGRRMLFPSETRQSPGLVLAATSLALAMAAVIVGSSYGEEYYVVCGPVLHIWEERNACADAMAGHRSWFTALAWASALAFVSSLVVGALTRQAESSSSPSAPAPPGTRR